jgi:hypothetical protein
MKKLLLILIFLIVCTAFFSCTRVSTKFVVLRDTPLKPVFTVIPFNNSYRQIDYANQVEEVLIKLGVKVEQRPTIKEIVTSKGLGEEKTVVDLYKSLAAGKKNESVVVESYLAYDEFKADYIVLSDLLSRRLKVINRNTKEVLTSLRMGRARGYGFEKIIYDSLRSLEITVKDLPKPVTKKKGPE